MTTHTEIELDVLVAAAPQIANEQARELAASHYGLKCTAKLLAGERDLNFHLVCEDGRQYLLKISNPAENPKVTDFQNQALQHIQRCDPRLPIQRVYPNQAGGLQAMVELNDQRVLVRLFSFVEGIPLNRVAHPDHALRVSLGEHLAKLGLALRGFFHPAAGHKLLWDLKHAAQLSDLIRKIDDSAARTLAQHFLENFERNAMPRLGGLRAQVIHNDLNFHNVIVEAQHPHRLRNILDFGDMVHAPLINDLAVAASYQLGTQGNPLEQALPFIRAYHQVAPLEQIEQELLFDLIATRLVMTVAITTWRASLYPQNREYILRNAPSALGALQGFEKLSRGTAQQQIKDACQLEKQ